VNPNDADRQLETAKVLRDGTNEAVGKIAPESEVKAESKNASESQRRVASKLISPDERSFDTEKRPENAKPPPEPESDSDETNSSEIESKSEIEIPALSLKRTEYLSSRVSAKFWSEKWIADGQKLIGAEKLFPDSRTTPENGTWQDVCNPRVRARRSERKTRESPITDESNIASDIDISPEGDRSSESLTNWGVSAIFCDGFRADAFHA